MLEKLGFLAATASLSIALLLQTSAAHAREVQQVVPRDPQSEVSLPDYFQVNSLLKLQGQLVSVETTGFREPGAMGAVSTALIGKGDNLKFVGFIMCQVQGPTLMTWCFDHCKDQGGVELAELEATFWSCEIRCSCRGLPRETEEGAIP